MFVFGDVQNKAYQFFGLIGYLLFIWLLNYSITKDVKNNLIHALLPIVTILFIVGIVFDYLFYSVINGKQSLLGSLYNAHVNLSQSYLAAFCLGIIALIGYLIFYFLWAKNSVDKNSPWIMAIRLVGFGYLLSDVTSVIAVNYPNQAFVVQS